MKKLVLALGGGGARGLAHIGLLKVLEQENIPIHAIAGTSMGALVGCAYGAGLSPAEIEAAAMRMSKVLQIINLVDLAIHRGGLIGGKRLRNFVSTNLRLNTTFDQLRLPVAAVAVDTLRDKSVSLTSGSVLDAAMASSAFPGLFPPVPIGDTRLIDGGMLDNVPAAAARELARRHNLDAVLLAVDVMPGFPGISSQRAYLADTPEFRRRLPDFIPGNIEDAYQAVWLMIGALTANNLAAAQPDLVLRPAIPADLLVFLGLPRAAEAIAAGEAAAQEMMPRLHTLLETPRASVEDAP